MRELSFPTLNRRDVLTLGIGAFVVAAIPLSARDRRRAFRRTVPVMGTIADLVVIDDDALRARAALDDAVAELRHVDAFMSRFRPDSDVGRINLAVGAEPVAVAPATALVVREALHWAERSRGRFDPCLGRLSDAWKSENSEESDSADVARFADAHLFRALDVDRHRGRDIVRITRPDAALDLGGIAKGHAVDRALAAIRARGIRDAIVNAGGDLATAGRSADGDSWRVGVRDPHDPTKLSDTLDLSDAAVATSGDYETATRRGGRLIHHILDPRTAAPRETSEGTHSLTVVAADCLTADAAATALFGMRAGSNADALLRGTGARVVSRA